MLPSRGWHRACTVSGAYLCPADEKMEELCLETLPCSQVPRASGLVLSASLGVHRVATALHCALEMCGKWTVSPSWCLGPHPAGVLPVCQGQATLEHQLPLPHISVRSRGLAVAEPFFVAQHTTPGCVWGHLGEERPFLISNYKQVLHCQRTICLLGVHQSGSGCIAQPGWGCRELGQGAPGPSHPSALGRVCTVWCFKKAEAPPLEEDLGDPSARDPSLLPATSSIQSSLGHVEQHCAWSALVREHGKPRVIWGPVLLELLALGSLPSGPQC